jgi:hypothetical protein
MRTGALVLLLSACAAIASAKEVMVRVVRDVPYLNDGLPKHNLDLHVPQGVAERP